MKHFYCLLLSSVLFSCNGIQKGEDLSQKDIQFIQKLGLLDEGETILQFHSQAGGFNVNRKAGNFISSKRLAAYWIDNNKSKTSINSALYTDIDTIIPHDFRRALTMGSYLKVVKKDGGTFNVYANGDSLKLWNFFNRGIKQWRLNRLGEEKR